MKKLLIALVIACGSVVLGHASSFDRIVGVGKDRERLTPQLIEARTRLLQDAQEFWLLRHPDAEGAAERIMKYWPIFESAAASVTPRLDPYLLAAICFVESYGRADAQSPTGPVGICQQTEASAHTEGLATKMARVKVGERVVRKARTVTRRGKKVTIPALTRPIYRRMAVAGDERLEPAKAIPAMARRVAKTRNWLVRDDLTVQEYHDGIGRTMVFLSEATGKRLYSRTRRGLSVGKEHLEQAKQLITERGLSYANVFFGNTPYYKVSVYRHLERVPDFGDTYSFRVFEVRELLINFRKDPRSYRTRFDLYRNRFRDGVAPNRMWTFYTPEQFRAMQFEDLEALQKARPPRLAPVPTPYSVHGLDPRTDGKDPIGSRNLPNQRYYIAADEAAIGLMIYIANELRLLQGQNFRPIEVTSLVRDVKYQDKLDDTNPAARTKLPTHTIAKAFDLSLKDKSAAYRRDLKFVLTDLESVGMLGFVPYRSQPSIHVIVHPLWSDFFTTVYRRAIAP